MTFSPEESPKIVSLNLSDAELVELIAERGAREATSVARDRINFFLVLIAVVIALLSGAASLWISSTIGNQVGDAEKRIGEKVIDKIAEQSLEAQRDLAQRINEQVDFAVMLTLVTSEVASLSGGYNAEKAEEVLRALEVHLLPQMPNFEGGERYFIQRRLEDILDRFINTGDYTRVFRIHDVFEDQLDLTAGIYISLANAVISTAVVRPDDLEKIQSLIERLLVEKIDPNSVEYEYQRGLTLLLHAGPDEWQIDDLQGRILVEDQRYSGFSTSLGNAILNLEEEIQPGKINHSPGAIMRWNLLIKAFGLTAE